MQLLNKIRKYKELKKLQRLQVDRVSQVLKFAATSEHAAAAAKRNGAEVRFVLRVKQTDLEMTELKATSFILKLISKFI